MTTKTDFHAVMELKEKYTPACPGIVSAAESALIQEILEFGSRNDIELQNIRDVTVMMYGKWADVQEQRNNHPAMMKLMDAMSAVTAVIDQEKFRRGLPV